MMYVIKPEYQHLFTDKIRNFEGTQHEFMSLTGMIPSNVLMPRPGGMNAFQFITEQEFKEHTNRTIDNFMRFAKEVGASAEQVATSYVRNFRDEEINEEKPSQYIRLIMDKVIDDFIKAAKEHGIPAEEFCAAVRKRFFDL